MKTNTVKIFLVAIIAGTIPHIVGFHFPSWQFFLLLSVIISAWYGGEIYAIFNYKRNKRIKE